MSSTKSTNVTWHDGDVSECDRNAANGHRGATVWFTGLSGSGKSTVARAVEAALFARGVKVYVLDGDNVRHGLCGDLGFSPKDRKENIRRVGHVASLFTDAGVVVLAAFISPFREDRDMVRSLHPDDAFFEVHVDCSLGACEARDPKGLYRMAREGKIKDFTGISSPYEVPVSPEATVNTSDDSIEASAATVVKMLVDGGVIGAG